MIKTEVGKVEILGTSPKRMVLFFTTTNSYILKGNFLEEILEIKQYKLKISGIIKNSTFQIIDYSLKNNICKNKNSNCHKFIGKVYSIENDYYLLTRAQKTIKLKGENLSYFTDKKVLIKGKYNKNNKTGEMKVEGFIILRE